MEKFNENCKSLKELEDEGKHEIIRTITKTEGIQSRVTN